jgi:hypothetical protein
MMQNETILGHEKMREVNERLNKTNVFLDAQNKELCSHAFPPFPCPGKSKLNERANKSQKCRNNMLLLSHHPCALEIHAAKPDEAPRMQCRLPKNLLEADASPVISISIISISTRPQLKNSTYK